MTTLKVNDNRGVEHINTTIELSPEVPFRILEWVKKALNPEAFGGDEIYDLGICQMAQNGAECSSALDIEGVSCVATSTNTAIISGRPEITKNTTVKVVKNGEIVDTGIKLHVRAYESGLVIATGIRKSGFLGGEFNLYISKMTTKNMKSSSIGYARKFESWKKLLTFMKKYTPQMVYFVENTPAIFSIEDIGDGVPEDLKSEAMVKELLGTINNSTKDIEDHGDIPEYIGPEEVVAEGLHRMIALDLYKPTLSAYRKGKLYMSENGIIYTLDEEAHRAVEKARERDLAPYHVIKSKLGSRYVYDVLYVSKYGEDWRGERPTADGYLYSWCWMPDFQDSEIGSIRVEKTFGGLRRTE